MKFIKTWWQGKWRDPSLKEVLEEEPEKPNIIYPLPRRILIELKTFWLRRWPILLPIIITTAVTLFIYFDTKATRKAEHEKQIQQTKSQTIHKSTKSD